MKRKRKKKEEDDMRRGNKIHTHTHTHTHTHILGFHCIRATSTYIYTHMMEGSQRSDLLHRLVSYKQSAQITISQGK